MDDKLLAAPEGGASEVSEAFSLMWNFYGLSWLTPIFSWLALIFLLALAAILAFGVWHFFLAPRAKGKVAKLAVFQTLLAFGEGGGYHCRHNLPLFGGGLRKVKTDFVLFSPYGIFVIDSKGLDGLIVGGEDDNQWRRMGGKAFKRRVFPNPLRQNRDNAKALQTMTGLPAHCFHPLVVFADGAVFQSPMPHNVIPLQKLADFIAARSQIVLSPGEIKEAIAAVASGKQNTPPQMIKTLRKYAQSATAKARDYARRIER